MPAAADAELCNDTSELLKRRNKRVTVQGWVCQQVGGQDRRGATAAPTSR